MPRLPMHPNRDAQDRAGAVRSWAGVGNNVRSSPNLFRLDRMTALHRLYYRWPLCAGGGSRHRTLPPNKQMLVLAPVPIPGRGVADLGPHEVRFVCETPCFHHRKGVFQKRRGAPQKEHAIFCRDLRYGQRAYRVNVLRCVVIFRGPVHALFGIGFERPRRVGDDDAISLIRQREQLPRKRGFLPGAEQFFAFGVGGGHYFKNPFAFNEASSSRTIH